MKSASGISVVQFWILARNIPLKLGDLVAEENETWQFLLSFIDLLDILLCPVVEEEEAEPSKTYIYLKTQVRKDPLNMIFVMKICVILDDCVKTDSLVFGSLLFGIGSDSIILFSGLKLKIIKIS